MIKRALVGLIVAASAACRGPAIERNPAVPFPALPDTMYTAAGAVPVVLVDGLATRDTTKLVAGRYVVAQNTIYVSRAIIDPKLRRRIAEHERCHAILAESGLGIHMSDEFEDFLCNAFANAAVNQLERGRP